MQHSAAARSDSYRFNQVRLLAGAGRVLRTCVVRNAGKSTLARTGLIWWFGLGDGFASGMDYSHFPHQVCSPHDVCDCYGHAGAAGELIVGCGRSQCSDLAAGQQRLQLLCEALWLPRYLPSH